MGRHAGTLVATSMLVLALHAASALAEEIAWSTDLPAAWATAQKANRPLLLFVTSSHCPFCRKMRSETLSNPGVARDVRDSYVPVVIDAGGQAEIAARLRVTSVPTTLLFTPDGRLADRVEGFVSAETLRGRLKSISRQNPAQ